MMRFKKKSGKIIQNDLEYSEEGFWNKLTHYAISAGREVVEKALCLYYAAKKPETPAWAKSTAIAALAYFILPTDAIPDFSPLIGYSDDLGALTLALSTIASYVDDQVREQAKATLHRWFGSKQDAQESSGNDT